MYYFIEDGQQPVKLSTAQAEKVQAILQAVTPETETDKKMQYQLKYDNLELQKEIMELKLRLEEVEENAALIDELEQKNQDYNGKLLKVYKIISDVVV